MKLLSRYYASLIAVFMLISPLAFSAAESSQRLDDRGAIKDFTQAIRLNRQDGESYSNRGLGYANQGNYQQPISDYNRGLAQILGEKNSIVKIKVENLGYEDLQNLKAKIPQNVTMLTFDDGPNPEITPKILDLLDKYNQKATFFVLGAQAREHPEIVRESKRRGHEIAIHTMTHPDLRQITPEERRQEIQQSVKVLKSILGENFKPVWFRAPYGALSPGIREQAYRSRNNEITKEINEYNLGLAHWTIITDDYVRNPKVSEIANQISNGSGNILVMHDSWKKNHTVAALEIGLKRLEEQGVTSIRMSDLFER
ncbi:MAG: polysaccharide deacetylase family protein [Prochloraceae cyanobacterium]|nr:polysaccharide deacetylase family protein [Prochloraceae cyanobacterium]